LSNAALEELHHEDRRSLTRQTHGLGNHTGKKVAMGTGKDLNQTLNLQVVGSTGAEHWSLDLGNHRSNRTKNQEDTRCRALQTVKLETIKF
jgi:hypothetical protein